MNTRFAQFKLVLLGMPPSPAAEPQPAQPVQSSPVHFADFFL